MKNLLLAFILFTAYGNYFSQPGKDGAYTVGTPNQVLNKYCPVAADIPAGSNTMTLSTGPGFSLCPGDLLMVYQAQGAGIDVSNSSAYGSLLNYNSAGLYEFKYVQSVNGNVVTVQSAFTNSFAVAGRVQAVKVPQYTTLTINAGGSLKAKLWKDTVILAQSYRFGGIVVIHATNIVNNGTISATGSGFRGGQQDQNANWTINTYFSANSGDGGEKGEGIAGYQTDYDALGGRYCYGAPANGGGGGTAHNSAGGGGANGFNGNTWTGNGVMVVDVNGPLSAWALDPAYTANGNALTNSSGGGRGGYCFGNNNMDATILAPGNPGWGGDSRRNVGGLGGRPLNNINAEARIYFGGGGGAGDQNNNASGDGASGGGIVYLIATGAITGSGNLLCNGNTPVNSAGCHCDGLSGGGAGGSIIIKTPSIANTQVVNAIGGNGGSQVGSNGNESEGPGGGGGGGYVAISAGGIVPAVTGGTAGISLSNAVTEFKYNGATYGANGQTGTVSNTFIPYVTIPQPVVAAPTTTQSTCTSTLNAFDLNLTFNPANPSYTINWSPLPAGVISNTQTSATGGIAPGVYNATILLGGGCSSVATSFTINPVPAPINFTVMPTYSLTCTQQTVYASLPPGNSYTWTNGLGTTLTGTTVGFIPPNVGTWTVTGVNPSGCLLSQTFAVVQNTVMPTNSVNPVTQAITCNSTSAVTFTGIVTNLTVNVQHDWYSPLSPLPGGPPIATSNNTITILSGNIPPGTYTLVTTNLVNGCIATKTVNITSLDAFPTFSVSSPTNFSVGCNPLHQTTISIVNPVSTQTPPSVCSFTFLPPGFGGVVTPSIILGNNTSTVTQLPGTWTVIVQDNSNFCRTILSVPIIQNTIAPNVSASLFTQTLTCYNPTVLATGTSSTPNTQVTWGVPSTPPLLSTSTVVIGIPANGPNTSTASLTYANYTVIATNTLNACQSTSVITINQNFKPPISSPTISIGTPTAIYCTVAGAPVVLTAGNSTTTSGGGPLAFAIPYLWEGPSPQNTLTGTSSYSAYVAGIYSLTIVDNYNGCRTTGTINVLDKTQPPVITDPVATSTLDCGNTKASLIVAITGPSTGLMYWFYKYPVGTAFSPSSAPIPNGSNPFFSGTSSYSIGVSMSGYYEYIVSNTLTGCQSSGTFVVSQGSITADFDADKISGYSPLTVNFTNKSASSLNSLSITSVWSYGNGTSETSTINSTSTTYTAPGTYTVLLFASKGACLDTTEKVIFVDMPSKLEVPNIFTPNGDGSNDVFFLKTANISEVTALIFDRWGNKVYETNSNTGNIAWDGKNLHGKECAAGIYFYVIKGKGRDDKEYEQKGNVSLYR